MAFANKPYRIFFKIDKDTRVLARLRAMRQELYREYGLATVGGGGFLWTREKAAAVAVRAFAMDLREIFIPSFENTAVRF